MLLAKNRTALFYENRHLLPLLSIALLSGCQRPARQLTNQMQMPADRPAPQTVTTIAFGSCSDQKRPQPLWDDILAQKPQVWVWLGDNIYGDSEDMSVLKTKYDQQKSNPVYQQLRQSATILSVWDNHDYGVNDGGKEYPRRKESQQLMLDFLDVPAVSPLRTREGGYSAHVFGPKGQRVKIILLDGRYSGTPWSKTGKRTYPIPPATCWARRNGIGWKKN